MADDTKDAPRPFDVKTVEYLLELMARHELSEVDLKEGELRIRLRKGGAMPVGFAPVATHAPAAVSTTPVASPPPAPIAAAKNYHEITSELPGTFYTRPAPDKQPYVTVGSKVNAETTVCLVTAMKVNNEIKAGISGTIVEIVATNDTFVDYGTVLFRVERS